MAKEDDVEAKTLIEDGTNPKVDQDTRDNFKTELCSSVFLGVPCTFGNQCSYAHGVFELRPRQLNIKRYKTNKCKNFSKDGTCPFGSRCRFLHSELRIDVGNDGFWLLSHAEGIVRLVLPFHFARKKLKLPTNESDRLAFSVAGPIHMLHIIASLYAPFVPELLKYVQHRPYSN